MAASKPTFCYLLILTCLGVLGRVHVPPVTSHSSLKGFFGTLGVAKEGLYAIGAYCLRIVCVSLALKTLGTGMLRAVLYSFVIYVGLASSFPQLHCIATVPIPLKSQILPRRNSSSEFRISNGFPFKFSNVCRSTNHPESVSLKHS
jgi:hypothetical protein